MVQFYLMLVYYTSATNLNHLCISMGLWLLMARIKTDCNLKSWANILELKNFFLVKLPETIIVFTWEEPFDSFL